MALYVYRAFEYKFCGLYDVETIKVIQADNLEDAQKAAEESSCDLILNTSNVYESLYEEALKKYQSIYKIPYEICEQGYFSDKFSTILRKMIMEDVCTEIFELNSDIINSFSIEELEKMANEDLEDFIANYAISINI